MIVVLAPVFANPPHLPIGRPSNSSCEQAGDVWLLANGMSFVAYAQCF